MIDSKDPLFAVSIVAQKRFTEGQYGNPPKPSKMVKHRLIIVQTSGEVGAKAEAEFQFESDFPGYKIESTLVVPAATVTPRSPMKKGGANG